MYPLFHYAKEGDVKVSFDRDAVQHIRFGFYVLRKEFDDDIRHFVINASGTCNFVSRQKPGGSAYIIRRNGKTWKLRYKGVLGTTVNRVNMLAIISACKSLPPGAYADIYTRSQYCILAFLRKRRGKVNSDLIELFRMCSAHLSGVRFHFIEGDGEADTWGDYCSKLAQKALEDICHEYHIPSMLQQIEYIKKMKAKSKNKK